MLDHGRVINETTLLTQQDILQLVTDVWQTVLACEIIPTATTRAAQTLAQNSYRASVSITGAWNGAVIIDVAPEHARIIASTIFALPETDLAAEEMTDALGEMINIVGGNIKALLPAPSTLGLPSVSHHLSPLSSLEDQSVSTIAFHVQQQDFSFMIYICEHYQ